MKLLSTAPISVMLATTLPLPSMATAGRVAIVPTFSTALCAPQTVFSTLRRVMLAVNGPYWRVIANTWSVEAKKSALPGLFLFVII